jgi:hypothetical protein
MSELGEVRRRRNRAEADALVAEFATSGLKREAFCQQRGMAVGTLDKYRRRAQAGRRSGAMLPVEVVWSTAQKPTSDTGRDCVLVVELRCGRRIEVSRGFDGETLKRLLTVLDGV